MVGSSNAMQEVLDQVARVGPANSNVLVLGDSFVNVFAHQAMGWGASAGFAEHLSRELGRPLDHIVRNDVDSVF